VSLSIKRVGLDGETIGQIYQVEKYDDFISKKFEELWDYLSTPKCKLDRSYGDKPSRQSYQVANGDKLQYEVWLNTIFTISF